jgi:hypothetical protein
VTLHVTASDDHPATPGPDGSAVLVQGKLTWGTLCYPVQRPLAGRFRLHVPDRRG